MIKDDRMESFLSDFNEDKIPVGKVQQWFDENYQIAPRTFQLHVKEGLIPNPQFEWKNGYYSKADLRDILCCILIIEEVRINRYLTLGMLRNIYRKYPDKFQKVLGILFYAVENFPTMTRNLKTFHNTEVLKTIFDDLLSGVDLDSYRVLDTEERLKEEKERLEKERREERERIKKMLPDEDPY